MSERVDGYSLDEIVSRFGGELIGDGSRRIRQVGTLSKAGPGELAFLSNPKYRSQLAACRAEAVILSSADARAAHMPCIVSEDPYAYFARVAQLLNPQVTALAGIHPAAIIESDLPPSASVGAGTCVGRNVRLGEHCVIGQGCVIGDDVAIGASSTLHGNVSVYPGCRIGSRAIIHSGAVIGADGFGFARESDGAWTKIPQIGRVVIGDDVEIGAGTTIDRGALEDTVIEDGVKLDNLIHIGHNCRLGQHVVIAAQTGIAGGSTIGHHAVIGGQVGIGDNVTIQSGAVLGSKSGVLPGKVLKGGGIVYWGVPAKPLKEYLETLALMARLPELRKAVRELRERLGGEK